MATSEMQNQNKEKARSRVLIAAAVAMLLLACGVFGSLFYLQNRAAAPGEDAIVARYAAEQVALEPVSAEVAKRVEHIRQMRAKWRPWALEHKQELKRMLAARPNDQSAMMAVYDAVPANPTVAEAGFSEADFKSGPVRLGWQPTAKLWAKANISDPNQQKQNEKDIREIAQEMQKTFASMRDIKLSSSMNTGRSQTVFWASGRITENKRIDNPKHGAGQPSLIEAPPQQIEPPYDFLQ